MNWYALQDIIVSVFLCAVMPVMIVWLVMRAAINKDNAQKAVLLAAVEKYSDVDIDKFYNKLSQKKKSLKERLLAKLLWGSILGAVGIAVTATVSIICTCQGNASGNNLVMILGGVVALLVGVAFIVNYFVSKKMLAKELEAEEKRLSQPEQE